MNNKEIVKIFLCDTITDIMSFEYNIPKIRFVFSKDALDKMQNILEEDKEKYEVGIKSLKTLYESTSDYPRKTEDDDNIYIKVDNPDEFFQLLDKLIKAYDLKDKKTLEYSENFLRSIWLRMGTNDISNVNNFLERQLKFIRNDDIINYNYTSIMKNKDIDLIIYNRCNEEWFETNNNVNFMLRNEAYRAYTFPSIHYAFSTEDGKPTCFIYGIQNLKEQEKNDTIKEQIQPIRRRFRNKLVSPDFIMVLSFFLDFLYENGICNVEVPLLQVFNYPYHEHLSRLLDEVYSGYSDIEKKEFDTLYENGDRTDKILDYNHNKKMYHKFAFKEDIISKNKTERLLDTFQILQDTLNNIEILNEPFIEGDSLKLKILKSTNILDEINVKSK